VAPTIRLSPGLEERARAFDAMADRGFGRVRGIAAVDRTFYAASALGDHSLLWHTIGAVRALGGDRQMAEALRLSAVLGVESVVVNVGIKSLFRRTRPVHTTTRPFALRRPLTSSFPSGHATSAFCAAVLLSKAEPRLRPVWYATATVVAASRVHVRIHHATDIVVGAAVGWALGHIACRLVPLPGPPAQP
jgi:undecaprenyl-diphosphatase